MLRIDIRQSNIYCDLIENSSRFDLHFSSWWLDNVVHDIWLCWYWLGGCANSKADPKSVSNSMVYPTAVWITINWNSNLEIQVQDTWVESWGYGWLIWEYNKYLENMFVDKDTGWHRENLHSKTSFWKQQYHICFAKVSRRRPRGNHDTIRNLSTLSKYIGLP